MTIIEQSRLDKVEEKLNNVENKVDKILIALVGDELTANDGLIFEFKALKDRVNKLEALKNRTVWFASGAGMFGGVGVVQLVKLFKEIFHI